jgi:EPS-associated MarR family transcriptional regulator
VADPTTSKSIDEDVRFRLLRLLEEYPEKSQRDISRELGISLGLVNYVLRALIDIGDVKIRNFRASENKLRYAYILTPRGIDAKARLAAGFIRRKRDEYEALKSEIESLEGEYGSDAVRTGKE